MSVASVAREKAPKKTKARANEPSSQTQTAQSVTDPAAQVQSLREQIAAAEKSKEKLKSWDFEKRREWDAKIAGLQQKLSIAELGAMPLPAAPSQAAMKFQELEVSIQAIVITGNHREKNDEAEVVRKQRSMQTLGLIQRIGLKDLGDGRFELIWGSRRLTAAKRIGWDEIPAKIFPSSLTAAEVEILRTIENSQQESLTPVERAISVARCIEAIEETLKWRIGPPKGNTSDVISANVLHDAIEAAGGLEAYVGQQLGFPAKWVKDNAYVSKLGGEARKLLAAHRIDVGHARELAKLGDPQICDDIADECARDESGFGGRDVDFCRQRVTQCMRSLKIVPWRLDVAFGAGKPGCTGQACATCKFNSKSDPDLFGGALADEPAAGFCTNEACFKAKQDITEKDLAKGVAKAVAKHGKSDFVVNDSVMASFVPVHVKLSTAARKAKKEIELEHPKGGDDGATGQDRKSKSMTPEEKAKEKFDQAYQKWVRESGEAVELALREDPRKFIAAAVASWVPPFEYAYDMDDKEVEKHPKVIQQLIACDADALFVAAVGAWKKKEKYRRRLPLFDDGSSDALVERLVEGWGLDVKSKPKIEDFLSKKPDAEPAAASKPSSRAKGKRKPTEEPEAADDEDGAGPDDGLPVFRTADLVAALSPGAYPGSPANDTASFDSIIKPPIQHGDKLYAVVMAAMKNERVVCRLWEVEPQKGQITNSIPFGFKRGTKAEKKNAPEDVRLSGVSCSMEGGASMVFVREPIEVIVPRAEWDEAEALYHGPLFDVKKCRVCGCTQENCRQCIDRTGEPCSWIEPDLCSACYPIVNFNWDDATAEMLRTYIAELTEVIDNGPAGNIRAVAIRQRSRARKSLADFETEDKPAVAPAKPKFHKLDDDVAEVLRTRLDYVNEKPGVFGVRITGDLLERNLYERANKTLIKLGGKWKGGKTQMHLFASDPAEAIAAAFGGGQVLDRKKTFQFFETPPELAARMVKLAELRPDQRILEPSAGRGAIADVINERMPEECELWVIELDLANVEFLQKRNYYKAVQGDFLSATRDEFPGLFDRILMNPPFSGGQDVEHVRHAYELLRHGGILVAIMSTSAWNNSDKRSKEFRDWMDEVPIDLEDDLPSSTFADTNVAAKLIVIHKPVLPGAEAFTGKEAAHAG